MILKNAAAILSNKFFFISKLFVSVSSLLTAALFTLAQFAGLIISICGLKLKLLTYCCPKVIGLSTPGGPPNAEAGIKLTGNNKLSVGVNVTGFLKLIVFPTAAICVHFASRLCW